MHKRGIYTVIWSVILILLFMIPAEASVPNPTNVERKTVNGTEYIVKTFDVSRNITAEMLIETDFESDGYMFRHTKTDRKENVSEVSKYEIRQAALDTSTNSRTEILSRFTQSMSYSEGGYFGTLTLDANSLVTQPSGYGARNVSVSRTREYGGLMFNDPSIVPQAITDDGVTLTLTGIDWAVTGTALAGDSLVPTEYKAIASYSGTQRVSYVLGYTTTVNYTGTVTKKTVDSINYTITYTGTFIPTTATATTEPPTATTTAAEPVGETEEIPDETEEAEENGSQSEDNGKNGGFKWILPAVIALCLAGAGVFGVIYYLKYIRKKQLKMEVYNLINNDYTLLGVEVLAETDISVDLNKYADSVQSNSFGFGLDKYTVEKLDGSKINIVYKEETFVHTVDKKENLKEYLFKFVFGEYY